MMRLHAIVDGPGKDNPCEVCLLEHSDCTIEDCKRVHKYLLDEEDYAGLVRTGAAHRAKYTSKPEALGEGATRPKNPPPPPVGTTDAPKAPVD